MNLFQWVKFIFLLIPVYFSALKQKNRSFEQRWTTLKKWSVTFFKLMKIEFKVAHHTPPSAETVYYVCNHQGLFDPILLMASAQNSMTFVSKVENLKFPVIGYWGKLIGFITFKREDFDANVTMLRQCARTLNSGRSILIFPEGTRSKGNALLPFKSGALLPAYLAKVSIVPVTQINTYEMDHLGQLKHDLQVIYDAPIPYAEYKDIPYVQMAEFLHDQIELNIKKALN